MTCPMCRDLSAGSINVFTINDYQCCCGYMVGTVTGLMRYHGLINKEHWFELLFLYHCPDCGMKHDFCKCPCGGSYAMDWFLTKDMNSDVSSNYA